MNESDYIFSAADGDFVAMLHAQIAEQNRLRAASVVSEFKLLPPKLQTETLALINRFCLRG